MRPTIGADQEGRIIILLMVSNLRFHRLEEVVHPRNTWSGFSIFFYAEWKECELVTIEFLTG